MPTVRTHNQDGSYQHVTTNEDGKEIRIAKFKADGSLTERTENDLETGHSEVSRYEDGKLIDIDRYDEFGIWLGGERLDEDGRIVIRRSPLPNGSSRDEEYEYDDENRIIRTTIVVGGSITETVYFDYDENGNLIRISRRTVDGNSSSEVDILKNGEPASQTRDSAELIAIARRILGGEHQTRG